MRFHWLLLSLLSTLLVALPAEAGKLLYWRFESNQNRLIFTTDSQVQPRAQLIPNPTRIVLDLPGVVLGRSAVEQLIGGAIKSVRVGQFNAQTTRLVIEMAPGYTLDPQQVKVRGISPTQWTVDLPTPQRMGNSSTPTPLPTQSPTPERSLPGPSSRRSNDFQVTRNGLFVRLDRNGNDNQIRVNRSDDQQTIEISLGGVSLPKSLLNQSLPVNTYGVSDIQFEQNPTSPADARISLRVSPDSPNWQGYYSRLGGLVLLPKGGLSQVQDLRPPEPSGNTPPVNNLAQSRKPIISAIELSNRNTQLLIRANQSIRGTGNLDRRTGIYTIRIPNAQLSETLSGPELGRNSPIYELKVRQVDGNTVEILVRPSLGIRFGSLTQANQQILALDIRSLSPSVRSPNPNPSPIDVSPPWNTSLPPLTSYPSDSVSGTPRGRVLVVIDPGHGGKDPGAIGLGGLQEKNVILPISLDVSRLLQERGVQVMLTRNADYFVSLQGRTQMANQARANIFVSIHANAVGGGRTEVNGLEVYYHGNRELADAIHRSIRRTVNIRDRGVRQARFYVLRTSRMPSSLVEVGFVTGAEDNANLSNPAYRQQMAQAIAQGILDYIQQKRL
ncbi:cell wall hydrolase/autolysin [Rippkaea orientalis PCC 8801]|uniref:Cell wall hydrolase/autolysin n=1 Tax=Rippkaea orientalis (strain PCC 8801 / RF-1) TaxID=41431 RepID=B7JWN1_RIPO1|nr:N-acetylmuramoyl-L-alanine amidase [Rippkaea orientalis]ACK64677.1 cell wall hydrolase/autolysin [Rippkaea orientalis PCC 8801]